MNSRVELGSLDVLSTEKSRLASFFDALFGANEHKRAPIYQDEASQFMTRLEGNDEKKESCIECKR